MPRYRGCRLEPRTFVSEGGEGRLRQPFIATEELRTYYPVYCLHLIWMRTTYPVYHLHFISDAYVYKSSRLVPRSTAHDRVYGAPLTKILDVCCWVRL